MYVYVSACTSIRKYFCERVYASVPISACMSIYIPVCVYVCSLCEGEDVCECLFV